MVIWDYFMWMVLILRAHKYMHIEITDFQAISIIQKPDMRKTEGQLKNL